MKISESSREQSRLNSMIPPEFSQWGIAIFCKREYDSLAKEVRYATSEYLNHSEDYREYYDEVEICETAAGGHFKAAFQTRNREMVDRSALTVFCVQRESGGAWQTMKYARKQGIPYINLNDPQEEAE